jgi:hypothetical protein
MPARKHAPEFFVKLFLKCGVFFSTQKPPRRKPRFTTKPPQLNHKSPRKNTHFSQHPLQKTPIKQQKPPRHHAEKKSAKKQV